eukprot:12137865-Ditylum_brightwellii.AAC.1
MKQHISELERGVMNPSNLYRGGMSSSFLFSSIPNKFDFQSVKVMNTMFDDSVKQLQVTMEKISHNKIINESKQGDETVILVTSEK